MASLSADGHFLIEGQDWPKMEGSWEAHGGRIQFRMTEVSAPCKEAGRYSFRVESGVLDLTLISDDCPARRLLLDGSSWRPEGQKSPVQERRLMREFADRPAPLPRAADSAGSWPSFRGSGATGSADGQDLPAKWDVKTGRNILWRKPLPGLAHSSPVIWGDRVFVTTAVSSKENATFRPGLYGDGDASDDRSEHRWVIYALDKNSGEMLWERTADQGAPRDKRHIKSTYASSTPVTDGRTIVAFFGTQGIYAYDVDGNFRWKVELGRLDLGAYNIPTVEWGTASSPILWDGKVIVQCDTQQDAFVLALDLATGETVWKTDRLELSSWASPTVVPGPLGPELVTNAANFIRGYDPRNGKELWRLGGSSKITAPTPIYSDGYIVVASGRRPERPIFVLRPGARGDLTLSKGQTKSDSIVWSLQGRGPYMPTPLIYRGILYVLSNNGIFDAYELATGKELYRARIPHLGSGFSASPVAADGTIYLSNEDGEIILVRAGSDFQHIGINSMGELLMATPALSEGALYVRTVSSLFAIGQKP